MDSSDIAGTEKDRLYVGLVEGAAVGEVVNPTGLFLARGVNRHRAKRSLLKGLLPIIEQCKVESLDNQ